MICTRIWCIYDPPFHRERCAEDGRMLLLLTLQGRIFAFFFRLLSFTFISGASKGETNNALRAQFYANLEYTCYYRI